LLILVIPLSFQRHARLGIFAGETPGRIGEDIPGMIAHTAPYLEEGSFGAVLLDRIVSVIGIGIGVCDGIVVREQVLPGICLKDPVSEHGSIFAYGREAAGVRRSLRIPQAQRTGIWKDNGPKNDAVSYRILLK
jgi:hypothetical protein